ncbi:hypothetical protein QFC21_007038 [Naganishia friedmannii]|uniref:Uncharacterized protein n=1 Tax=Naganishia friedmannii TaxID=89922 RepID=A0ACC2UYI0_9TREE|nr:hypothetical protein QFC21_007038 [Naganishia friedmannii]
MLGEGRRVTHRASQREPGLGFKGIREPEDENETEDDVNNVMIFLKNTGSGLNEKIHQRLTDNLGTEDFLSDDMGNRLSKLDARLKDVADEDIVVKKLQRSATEERDINSEVIAIRLADVSSTSGICAILAKVLKRSYSWLFKADGDSRTAAIFRRVAPGANCLLVHPHWHPDGNPFMLLFLAWKQEPLRKDEIQSFVASLMTGMSAALTMHKARRMEKAQIAFGNVQAHLTDFYVEHKREFEEGLKAVENASIQLESVMRNILSYFELESDVSPTKVRWEAFALEKQAPRSLEATLNEVLLSLTTRDTEQRRNDADNTPEIKVVLRNRSDYALTQDAMLAYDSTAKFHYYWEKRPRRYDGQFCEVTFSHDPLLAHGPTTVIS